MSIQNVYQDAVISGGGNRKYRITPSGSYQEIEDVTTYSVTGSNFGAEDANELAEGEIRIDTGAASGDDKDLTDALTSAGWTAAIDTNVLSKNLFAKLVNFYVANGYTEYTDNNWTVKKYNNGTFEAWRKYTATNVTIGTAAGSAYQTASNLTLQLPSGVTSSDVPNITPISSSYGVWPAVYGFTTSQISYRLMSSASRSSTNYTIGFYIKGTM